MKKTGKKQWTWAVIGLLLLGLIVGCEHLHLFWLGAGITSLEMSRLGSGQQALLCIHNSVWGLVSA